MGQGFRSYSEAAAGAAGAATATVRIQSKSSETWVVSQVTVEMPTAPAGATCTIRKNGTLVTPVVAQADAASGDPPIVLRSADTMTVEWRGCDPGNVGTVGIVYDQSR